MFDRMPMKMRLKVNLQNSFADVAVVHDTDFVHLLQTSRERGLDNNDIAKLLAKVTPRVHVDGQGEVAPYSSHPKEIELV